MVLVLLVVYIAYITSFKKQLIKAKSKYFMNVEGLPEGEAEARATADISKDTNSFLILVLSLLLLRNIDLIYIALRTGF